VRGEEFEEFEEFELLGSRGRRILYRMEPAMRTFEELGHRGRVSRLRQLAAKALAAYDVRPVRVSPLPRGDNVAFRVETADGQRYVLRIHRVSGDPWHPRRNAAQVESELTWLAVLRCETDLVVPEPVPNRLGGLLTIVEVEGVPEPRICVLLRWVEGRFLEAGLTPWHLECVGGFMARLHTHALGFEPPEGFVRGRLGDTSPEVAKYVEDTVADVRGRDAAAIAVEVIGRARETQRALGDTPEAFGLIHGDLHQENYLFHRSDVRAIDFDDCGWGHLLWDLAVTLSEVRYFPHYETLRSAALRGYRQERPLPEDLERHLEPLMALRLLQLMLWFLEQRDNPAFTNWEDEVEMLQAELTAFASA
jgi:Ser/Thr protein kinase RdoA (MazF antagonist)